MSDWFINYASQYPVQDTDHVKATSSTWWNLPFHATDSTKSLIGVGNEQDSWISDSVPINQCFHIAYPSPQIFTKLYYENYHSEGGLLGRGAKNFTLWGSNSDEDFNDLSYDHNGTWEELILTQYYFDQHCPFDRPDPKEIGINNVNAYKYKRFKFADNWGGDCIGFRRVELKTQDWVLSDKGNSFDYFDDSLVVGWETIFAGSIRIYRIDTLVFVSYYISGVSNNIVTTFTVPYIPKDWIHARYAAMTGQNNGVPLAGALACKDDFNDIMKCYSDGCGGGWTPSGYKTITGQMWFEVALPE